MRSIKLTVSLVLLSGFLAAARAQDIHFYSSGSTGADGAFNPVFSGGVLTGVPPGTKTSLGAGTPPIRFIDVPLNETGVFNFTTVNVPGDMRVRFIPNAANTPVIWLATGDITITGEIDVSSEATRFASESSSATPGPGGFRGGELQRPGNGPLPGVNASPVASDLPLSIPLVGGSGGTGTPMLRGAGGGGVLYLASSGKIAFPAATGPAGSGLRFSGQSSDLGRWAGAYGAVALFANEVSEFRATLASKVLVSAIRYSGAAAPGFLTFPVTLVGIPLPAAAPLARITSVGGVAIPENADSSMLFNLPAVGNQTLQIETRNLPPGVIFRATTYRLDNTGRSLGSTFVKSFSFPPTEGTRAAAAASADFAFASGITFITAVAVSPITLASAPIWRGDRLKEFEVAIDSNGVSRAQFRTESGVILSHEAALRLAFQQGKWDFLKQFGA